MEFSVPKIDYLAYTKMEIETNYSITKLFKFEILSIIGQFDKILLNFCDFFPPAIFLDTSYIV